MINDTNLTSPTVHLRSYGPIYGKVLAGLHIIVIIIAICGNMLVCCAIQLSAKLRRSPTTMFIFSLAISDLITASIGMPFDTEILLTSGLWYHGEIMCKVWTVIYLIAVPTSILTLLALSVDRYKTLSDPLNRFRRSRFMTRKRAITVIIMTWIYCCLIAILPVAKIINTFPFVYNNQCYFPMPPLYNIINTFVNFVLPILITCGLYAKIYQIAKLQPLQHQRFSAGASGRQKMQKDYLKNIRAAKTISMFVGAFVFCWLPYSTMTIVANFSSDEVFYSIPPHVYPALLLLGYVNSALNPFLFSFRNRAFKGTFWRMYYTVKRRRLSQSTSRSINSSSKRSELPDAYCGTDVQMFSIRSLSQSDPTPPESGPDEPTSSREPLNGHFTQLALDHFDIAKSSSFTDTDTYL